MEQGVLNFDGPALTYEESLVLDALLGHEGKGNEIGGRVIAERTGIEYDRVRAIIGHLVNRHRKMIGSNGKGYYLPVTKEEGREVTRSLRHRGMMDFWRAANLERTSITEIIGQTLLEFKRELEKGGNL